MRVWRRTTGSTFIRSGINLFSCSCSCFLPGRGYNEHEHDQEQELATCSRLRLTTYQSQKRRFAL